MRKGDGAGTLRGMEKKVTQKDIAKALGISLITVQRALNHSGYVSREMKERIAAYAARSGYKVDRAARSLVKKRKTVLAVLTGDDPPFFWEHLKSGIDIAREQTGLFHTEIELHRIPAGDRERYGEVLEDLIGRGAAAFGIVNNTGFDMPAVFSRLDKAGRPYITLNIDAPRSNRLCHVGSDYAQGGRLAANYLAACLKRSPSREVLIIQKAPPEGPCPEGSFVESVRSRAFREVLERELPAVNCRRATLSPSRDSAVVEGELEAILADGPWDGIYFLSSQNELFTAYLRKRPLPKEAVVLIHDMHEGIEKDMDEGLVDAAIFQNPALQGFYAAKILEGIAENGLEPQGIRISNSLILKEGLGQVRDFRLQVETLSSALGL